MTTPNIDWVLLPETSIFVPATVKADVRADMTVTNGRKLDATSVPAPVGVLLLQVQIDIVNTADPVGIIAPTIHQNGKRRAVLWLTNLPKGSYSYMTRVIVDDPNARLYVQQHGFGTTAQQNTRVGVTVFPLGTVGN